MIKVLTHRKIAGLSCVAAVGVMLYMGFIHDFLAVTRPVEAPVLVVEGWVWDKPAMREAAAEFKKGGYECVICVGGPEDRSGRACPANCAVLAASSLIDLGIDRRYVHVVSLNSSAHQRTLGAARATSEWLRKDRPNTAALNVFTLGTHARKSWLLFKKVFGGEADVGIISGTESAYPVKYWWTSRTGVYLVIRNTMGYLYALAIAG